MNSDVDQYAIGWGALALINASFARAKADSGAAPPPLHELLYPEV